MTPKNKNDKNNLLSDELVDQLLEGYTKPEDLIGEGGILKQLTGRLVERVLNAEMAQHLGYEKNDVAGRKTGNSRNGSRKKRLITDRGPIEIENPRDRDGSFEPVLVKKCQRRFDGFDDVILSLYAHGMTVREIQGHLSEMYGTEVSPDLISQATAAVADDVKAWRARPLEEIYAIVYLDAIVIKVRDEGVVQNKAVYVAIGVTAHGNREILGLWIAQTEGAKFWLRVLSELKARGVKDILIVCVDGLTGFPEAIESAFPNAMVQTCVVHMIRNSLRFVGYKERKKVAADLKPVYKAINPEAAESALVDFEEKWGNQFPMIAEGWRGRWEQFIPFLSFPADLRKVIYTTNQVEAVNSSLRRLVKTRGHFPNDDAALKLLYLGVEKLERKWTRAIPNWPTILGQLTILFPNRLPNL
ncbi:IS256 family transposase [Candidatus Wolfebacteria bacterium]|nr:IS256 family transposase [Candidatus Wolfebacteria bacterium]